AVAEGSKLALPTGEWIRIGGDFRGSGCAGKWQQWTLRWEEVALLLGIVVLRDARKAGDIL
ncbi:unnamed protein product, partial [marine sediment metagenome]